MNVFVLATCRDQSLLPFTALVFDTIRTGFPTANVRVFGNNLPFHMGGYAGEAVRKACEGTGCEFMNGPATIHHDWIESLCRDQNDPFVILDTDVIFYESVEGWTFDTALAGDRIPEWQDEFSGSVTRSRLHTSLLFINPNKLREDVEKFFTPVPNTPFTPKANLFHPVCTPLRNRVYFHDTCSLLYHAIGGTAFSDVQLDAFFHFNFGTIPDLVLPRLSGAEQMQKARDSVLASPGLGCGAWRSQKEYYRVRPANETSPGIAVDGFNGKDAVEARKWNEALCLNDPEAMAFTDLWYRYCHGIDDLIDTMQDGRPAMNHEQILELFALAAMLYNCRFFVKNREMLFPVVLSVTNSFADSVSWEKSPIYRRRMMADVLRTCGNEMYNTVALLKGGWKHLREIGPKIRERDWIGQHDDQDRPN